MSKEFPIIALTGSSGSGSSAISAAFQHIFRRERVKAAYIQGNAFRRHERKAMKKESKKARKAGETFSHFGPEANHLDKLDSLLFQYANTGTGVYRYFLHTEKAAEKFEQKVGTLTPWMEMDPDTDLLLYRGLHGAVKTDEVNINRYPDLKIGVVPAINLEWIRRIHRDTRLRGRSLKHIRQSIQDRMSDYVRYITPQFSRTHINFQLVPVVDTSNPFSLRDIPTLDECILIIHFRKGPQPDYLELMRQLPGSFISRKDHLVVPGGKLMEAVEVVLMPLVHDLVTQSRKLRGITDIPKDRGAGVLGMMGQNHF